MIAAKNDPLRGADSKFDDFLSKDSRRNTIFLRERISQIDLFFLDFGRHYFKCSLAEPARQSIELRREHVR
jgi:hypothetical protein